MNFCIGVPATELRLDTEPARIVLVHVWSYTERQWLDDVCFDAVRTGAGFAQAVAAFTSRMKGVSGAGKTQGASCPFLFGVSHG